MRYKGSFPFTVGHLAVVLTLICILTGCQSRRSSLVSALYMDDGPCPGRYKCKQSTTTITESGDWTYAPLQGGEELKGSLRSLSPYFHSLSQDPAISRAWGRPSTKAKCLTSKAFSVVLSTSSHSYERISCQTGGKELAGLAATVQKMREAVVKRVAIQLERRAVKLQKFDLLSGVAVRQSPFGRRCINATFRFSRAHKFTAVVERIEFTSAPIHARVPFSAAVEALQRAGVSRLLRSYPIRAEDLTNVSLDLFYSDDFVYSVRAPDRSMWPAALTKAVKALDRLAFEVAAVRSECGVE